jgi:aminoglycoside phosphotransferase
MRTTVRIEDTLLARAKEFAARNRRSLNSVLEDALREMLDRQQQRSSRPPVDLVVHHGDGLLPGVYLDDNAALHNLMDEVDATGYRTVAGDPG